MIKINERYKQIYHSMCFINDMYFLKLDHITLTRIAQLLYFLGYDKIITELSPIYEFSEDLENEKENS